MKKLKKIPKFNTEKEENFFWKNNDSTEYVNYTTSKQAYFQNLRPSIRSISLRLPEILLDRIKITAHKKDIPYQTLIKLYLTEMVKKEH